MRDLVGKEAPDFVLEDQNEKSHFLSDYRGQKVFLYFYPKDDTPGCTLEGQLVQRNIVQFEKLGVKVFGISPDSVESHRAFACKAGNKFGFSLLADDDGAIVSKNYGVWVEKNMFGKKFMGVQRDSFLIDEKGIVVKHYAKVNPRTHVDDVLADLQSM